MKSIDILLIYPQLGSFDNIVRDIPLSVIYAATDSVKHGYNVQILDMRLHPEDWEEQLDRYLEKGCKLIGLSVMTGNPIFTSLKISKYIKSHYDVPIVWGGPHPTILPEQTLENENIDYIIRDWGSKSLYQLIQYISGGKGDINAILGLGYKENGKVVLNSTTSEFEKLHYLDIPYDLVDISAQYKRLIGDQLIFPIFTSLGCPYKCTFCISPAIYEKIKGKKWISYDNKEVLDHIEYIDRKYNFKRLQVYDDDSFVDLKKKFSFFVDYIKMGFHKKYKLDFRAVRINELDRMDDNYLSLMEEANVEVLMIGAESGSNNTLKRMNKNITVEATIRVNKKLSRFPKLRPMYNMFCGSPGETLADIMKTKELMIQLPKDNPYCYLGLASDWKPIPGTVITNIAVDAYKFKLPSTLEEWGAVDTFDAKKIIHPWYTKEMDDTIRLLQVAGQLLDRKITDFRADLGFILGNSIYITSMLYRPILLLRLKFNITLFLFEYHVEHYMIKHMGDLKGMISRFFGLFKPSSAPKTEE